MSGDFDDIAGFLEDAVRMLKEDEERYFSAMREHKKNGTAPPTNCIYDDKIESLILGIAKKMKVPKPRMSNNPYILELLRHEAEEREEAATAVSSTPHLTSSPLPTMAAPPAGGGKPHHPPITNVLGVTEEEVIYITSRACVVCGRDDRPIEMRKSGIKCRECRGKPSKKGARIEVELEVSNHVIKGKAADGSSVINGFKEKKQLGQGAFGKVKLVEHVLQEQHYAMKVLSKKGLTRKVGSREKALDLINNEINLMKTIQHHLVVKVISVIHDPDEDKLFIVMEYLARGQVYTLDGDGIGKVPPIPTMKLKKYVLGIARGLQYLHNRNVVHRDIKPENILLDDDDNTKIADFGVSSLCEDGDDEVVGAAGTVPYWPPEMFSSDSRTVKGRAQDVWAFGVTIYAMATGRLPFRGEWSECKRQITSGVVDYPESMDPQLKNLLQGMLTVDPRQRATIPDVCGHPFVSEILLSKGFPVEADVVKIAVVKSMAEADTVPLDTDAVLLCPFPGLAPASSENVGYAELVAFLRGESPGIDLTGEDGDADVGDDEPWSPDSTTKVMSADSTTTTTIVTSPDSTSTRVVFVDEDDKDILLSSATATPATIRGGGVGATFDSIVNADGHHPHGGSDGVSNTHTHRISSDGDDDMVRRSISPPLQPTSTTDMLGSPPDDGVDDQQLTTGSVSSASLLGKRVESRSPTPLGSALLSEGPSPLNHHVPTNVFTNPPSKRATLYDPIVGPPPIQTLAASKPTCREFQLIAGKYFVQLYRKAEPSSAATADVPLQDQQ